MYAAGGRRSVPPEVLLKATVLMAMYSIRSERAFCERLNYDLLFKWFLDMRIDQPAFDATTFTKNRKRLLQHEVADEFFAAVVRQAKLRRYISAEHFSVDGTLLKPGPPTSRSSRRTARRQNRRRAATSRSSGTASAAPTTPTPRRPTRSRGSLASRTRRRRSSATRDTC